MHMPEAGERYVHYKGGSYKVVTVGRLSEQRDQVMVVYQSDETEETWIRPLGMFTEPLAWHDGKMRARFTLRRELDRKELAALKRWVESCPF